ncbi:MAG: DNA mismatch repair endonuclease MutL [Cryobacterium sp.]|nr:DNA mismatch repair endonuclease MutL [Oligoflexia bacterium]
MKRIEILSPLVAERIAAGEVVERPGSVVKELVENALDAGATEVSVRLEDGGKALIEVLDNGNGMSREDLEIAVLRHATSKIREVSDLERLSTLGFRGEALPSISACADLSILSREIDSDLTLEWREGKVTDTTFGSFHGKKHGTRMQVRALFSQIPARLKFLKSATSEVSAVRDWMERLAFTHPHVGFKLETEARVLFSARPEEESARVARILGDSNDFPVITEETVEAGAIRARIHWLQGATSPQMRKMVQIVNGRAVRDRLVQQALLSPFRQALLPGQFPALALYLDLPPQLLDVNVHPTKTELRFLNSSQIFRTIQRLGEEMVKKHGSVGFARGEMNFGPGATVRSLENSPFTATLLPGSQNSFFSSASDELTSAMQTSRSEASRSEATLSLDGLTEVQRSQNFCSEATPSLDGAAPKPAHPFTPDRFAGILFQTYLMYDFGHELALVDQHAAHERIRFEILRKRALSEGTSAPAQVLLLPEVVKFPVEDRNVIEARLPLLEKLGFESEIFGEENLLFRAIPAEWGTANLRTRLFSLVEKLRNLADDDVGERLKFDERLFEKLASEACHSAVRAGDRINPEVAAEIVSDLMACEHPWNCPHGRPTVARVPRTRFEEWFQRRV